MRSQHTSDQRSPNWTLGRLRALVVAGLACSLLAGTGLVLAATQRHAATDTRLRSARPFDSGSPSRLASQNQYDELAARSMPTFGLEAAQPQAVALGGRGPSLVLPRPSAMGDAGVPTGFPQTVEGALAQLAAIDQTAFASASLARARDLVTHWAVPGGPDESTWSVLAALARLLDASGVAAGESGQVTITLTPVMGLIKGTVGTDFVIPCIDFEIDVAVTQTARAAIADCARMVWQRDRWLIGAGPEPADPPSVWPDTELAWSVGYRDVRRG